MEIRYEGSGTYLDVVTTAVLVGMITSTTRIVHLKREKDEEEEGRERGNIVYKRRRRKSISHFIEPDGNCI